MKSKEPVRDIVLGKEISFEEACARNEINPKEIIKRVGNWVVTKVGLESLNTFYYIEKKRLGDPTWLPHMAEKNWVNINDFREALEFARKFHNEPQWGQKSA